MQTNFPDAVFAQAIRFVLNTDGWAPVNALPNWSPSLRAEVYDCVFSNPSAVLPLLSDLTLSAGYPQVSTTSGHPSQITVSVQFPAGPLFPITVYFAFNEPGAATSVSQVPFPSVSHRFLIVPSSFRVVSCRF